VLGVVLVHGVTERAMNSPPQNSPGVPKKGSNNAAASSSSASPATATATAATGRTERPGALGGDGQQEIVRAPITQLVKLDFGGQKFTTSIDTLTSGEGENFFKVSRKGNRETRFF
jgi:hypothetical protein